MSRLTIYYSVENGGDGSAYPVWFDTKKLAEWHQEHLVEGWGEPCTGYIIVEGDNLRCSELTDKEGHYLELFLEYREDDDEVNEFRSEFFPNGLPEFTVKIFDSTHYGVFVEGRLAHKSFAYPEKKSNAKGVKRLTKLLTPSSDGK